MNHNTRPYLGLGILIIRNGKFLLGKRLGSHGEGDYSLPGGHIEWGETIAETAHREAYEETGIAIDNIRLLLVGNYKFQRKEGERLYVGIGVICDWKAGEAVLKEPQKCEGWDWYDTTCLPSPLFSQSRDMITSYQEGFSNKLLEIWS